MTRMQGLMRDYVGLTGGSDQIFAKCEVFAFLNSVFVLAHAATKDAEKQPE